MPSFNPGGFGVDFSSSTHALPRQVGGDPTTGLGAYTSATFGPVVREVKEACITRRSQHAKRVA